MKGKIIADRLMGNEIMLNEFIVAEETRASPCLVDALENMRRICNDDSASAMFQIRIRRTSMEPD
jgi:hypothetical protein